MRSHGGVPYNWKRTYERHGEAGLINKSPFPVNMPLRMPQEIEANVPPPTGHLPLRSGAHRLAPGALPRPAGLEQRDLPCPTSPRPVASTGQLQEWLVREAALREAGPRPPRNGIDLSFALMRTPR